MFHRVRSKSKDWNNLHQVRSKSKDWQANKLKNKNYHNVVTAPESNRR
jgi:hypothetical protein